MDHMRRILVVEDEEPLRRLLQRRLARRGGLVEAFGSAEEAVKASDKSPYDVALVDIKLSGMDGIQLLKQLKEQNPTTEVIIVTGRGTIDSAISAMKLGAYDYLTKPCKLSELDIVVQRAYEKRTLQEANINLRDELSLKIKYDEIIGKSDKTRTILGLIHKVAPSNSTVLIEGESGTGKELVAHSIHDKSPRRDNPFIVIHCTALPESLLESELFGYEKGAFTGAVKRKRGLVELAGHGTLFVDEVAEINAPVQAKLLRFIETGLFRRLGGGPELQLDVRIVAATNCDLRQEVKGGRFREDLYYRLNVVNIHLPPLRERRGDIPLLIDHFLGKKKGARVKKKLTREAMAALQRYDWPGNIRELANVIERAIILSSGAEIGIDDLAIQVPGPDAETKTLAELEREHISKTLALVGGNKTRAARTLGISLRNLYRKIERYGL
jgi:DNA-binding NtrC family response regulator